MHCGLIRTGRADVNTALDEIVAAANRRTPEDIARVIDVLDLRGTVEDLEDTAVGNYIADRILARGLVPACYTILLGTEVSIVDPRGKRIIGEATITGTLHDTDWLIGDDEPGFGHLHESEDDDEPGPTAFAADRAHIDAA